MARAIRSEISITVRFTSAEELDEDILETLEVLVNEHVRDEFDAWDISSDSDYDYEGITV